MRTLRTFVLRVLAPVKCLVPQAAPALDGFVLQKKTDLVRLSWALVLFNDRMDHRPRRLRTVGFHCITF